MLSGRSSSLLVPYLAPADRYHLVKSLVDINELVLRVVLLRTSSTLGFSWGTRDAQAQHSPAEARPPPCPRHPLSDSIIRGRWVAGSRGAAGREQGALGLAAPNPIALPSASAL